MLPAKFNLLEMTGKTRAAGTQLGLAACQGGTCLVPRRRRGYATGFGEFDRLPDMFHCILKLVASRRTIARSLHQACCHQAIDQHRPKLIKRSPKKMNCSQSAQQQRRKYDDGKYDLPFFSYQFCFGRYVGDSYDQMPVGYTREIT